MTNFLLASAKNTKNEPFLSKHDNQTNDPIFYVYSLSSTIGIFHFCISRPSKFSSMGLLPPLHYVLVCKIHIYMRKITLSNLLTQTSLGAFTYYVITFSQIFDGPSPLCNQASSLINPLLVLCQHRVNPPPPNKMHYQMQASFMD